MLIRHLAERRPGGGYGVERRGAQIRTKEDAGDRAGQGSRTVGVEIEIIQSRLSLQRVAVSLRSLFLAVLVRIRAVSCQARIGRRTVTILNLPLLEIPVNAERHEIETTDGPVEPCRAGRIVGLHAEAAAHVDVIEVVRADDDVAIRKIPIGEPVGPNERQCVSIGIAAGIVVARGPGGQQQRTSVCEPEVQLTAYRGQVRLVGIDTRGIHVLLYAVVFVVDGRCPARDRFTDTAADGRLYFGLAERACSESCVSLKPANS